jgi:hypothetical protein
VVVKILPQSCSSMQTNHNRVVDVSEPFSWCVVYCIQCCILKVFCNYITHHWRMSLQLPYSAFADRVNPQTEST